MAKDKKKLRLYYKWMDQGFIDSYGGLCGGLYINNLSYKKFSKLMRPSHEGWYHQTELWYWGSDDPNYERRGKFTELRQNLFLIYCAICNEL